MVSLRMTHPSLHLPARRICFHLAGDTAQLVNTARGAGPGAGMPGIVFIVWWSLQEKSGGRCTAQHWPRTVTITIIIASNIIANTVITTVTIATG